jgi:hypothetical protein
MNLTLEDAYQAQYILRGYVTDPPGDGSELDLWANGDTDLLLVAPNGSQTGFDPKTQTRANEIVASAYATDQLEDGSGATVDSGVFHSIQVRQPAQGTYSVVVSGVAASPYTLRIVPYSQDASNQPPLLVPGIAGIGSTSTFTVQFDPLSGSVPQVTRIATFLNTLADIQNGLQLGLIANEGVANSLSQKIDAAADAVARGQRTTSRNILDAFKSEVQAQTGNHLTSVASEVLVEDADYLISQTH